VEASTTLAAAGALEAFPETIEASLRLGATALRILHVPTRDIDLTMQEIGNWHYEPVIEKSARDEDAR
jgi:CPA2 family monovalent cation:H+ antiporter-2